MSLRSMLVVVCAALVLGACAKKHDQATDNQTRTLMKMLEAAERDGLDAGAPDAVEAQR